LSYVDIGKDGPLVFDAPPMLQGILIDFWQRPIPVDGGRFAGDVGFFGPVLGPVDDMPTSVGLPMLVWTGPSW
jgi:hypothetical protein